MRNGGKIDRFRRNITAGFYLWGCLLLSSCSSSPSDEEMKQLKDLQVEISALESKLQTMQRDKEGMERQIREKNAKLQQCLSDQAAVKKGHAK